MPQNRKAPTNLENRHGAEKPRALAIPSLCGDWLGKERGKKDPGVPLLFPGPLGNVTGVSPVPSSAQITVMYLVLLLTNGSLENGLQKVLDPVLDFMASGRVERSGKLPGLKTCPLLQLLVSHLNC